MENPARGCSPSLPTSTPASSCCSTDDVPHRLLGQAVEIALVRRARPWSRRTSRSRKHGRTRNAADVRDKDAAVALVHTVSSRPGRACPVSQHRDGGEVGELAGAGIVGGNVLDLDAEAAELPSMVIRCWFRACPGTAKILM